MGIKMSNSNATCNDCEQSGANKVCSACRTTECQVGDWKKHKQQPKQWREHQIQSLSCEEADDDMDEKEKANCRKRMQKAGEILLLKDTESTLDIIGDGNVYILTTGDGVKYFVRIFEDSKIKPTKMSKKLYSNKRLKYKMAQYLLIPAFKPSRTSLDAHTYDIVIYPFVQHANLQDITLKALRANYINPSYHTLKDKAPHGLGYKMRMLKIFEQCVNIAIAMKDDGAGYVDMNVSPDSFIITTDVDVNNEDVEWYHITDAKNAKLVKIDHKSMIKWKEKFKRVHKPMKVSFRAPEVNRERENGIFDAFDVEKANVYQYGATFIYVLYGQLKHCNNTGYERWMTLPHRAYSDWVDTRWTPCCLDMEWLHDCVKYKPNDRPTYDILLSNIQRELDKFKTKKRNKIYHSTFNNFHGVYAQQSLIYRQNSKEPTYIAPKRAISAPRLCSVVNKKWKDDISIKYGRYRQNGQNNDTSLSTGKPIKTHTNTSKSLIEQNRRKKDEMQLSINNMQTHMKNLQPETKTAYKQKEKASNTGKNKQNDISHDAKSIAIPLIKSTKTRTEDKEEAFKEKRSEPNANIQSNATQRNVTDYKFDHQSKEIQALTEMQQKLELTHYESTDDEDGELLLELEQFVHHEIARLNSVHNQLIEVLSQTTKFGIMKCPQNQHNHCYTNNNASNDNNQQKSNQNDNNPPNNNVNRYDGNDGNDGNDENEDIDEKKTNELILDPCNHLTECTQCCIKVTRKCEETKIFKALLLRLQEQHESHVSFVGNLSKAIAKATQKRKKKSKAKNRKKIADIMRYKPRYDPTFTAVQNIKISRRLTEEIIPNTVKEPIAPKYVYSYLNKSIAMQHNDKQLILDPSNDRIPLNTDFHEAKTNEPLYGLVSKINQQHYKWKLDDKLYTEIELSSFNVPSSSRDSLRKIGDITFNEASVDKMIKRCQWNTIPVFNVENNKKRITLAMTQKQLNPMIKKSIESSADFIPILMFDHHTHWMECLVIVTIDDIQIEETQIAVSLRYYETNEECGFKISGIHLNKDKLLEQHIALHPHECHCLDTFDCRIHNIRVGNPDSLENKMNALNSKYHAFKQLIYTFVYSEEENKYETFEEQARMVMMYDNGTLNSALRGIYSPPSPPSSSSSSYGLQSPQSSSPPSISSHPSDNNSIHFYG